MEYSFYQSFENMVVSLGLHGCSLLLACVYRPPGSCTCNFQEEFMSFVGFLSSINSAYHIVGDFNIHVDVPGGDGYKFMTFLDSCDLKQLVNQPTHLLNICSIVLLHQAVHALNKVQYRRYHHMNMCNFHSDFKNTSFVKSPANAVADPYEQYIHDLVDVLDKHAPLISRLKKKDSADWVSDSY